MPDEFDLLAAKVLAGEASVAEEEHLRNMLSRNAELANEFNHLKGTWDTVRHLGVAADAMDAVPVAIPPRCLQNLQELVQKKFGQEAPVRMELASGEPSHVQSRAPNTDADAERASAAERRTRAPSASLLWRFLIHRVIFTSAAWAGAALVLVLLLGSLFVLLRHGVKDVDLVSEPATVAYMITTQGTPEVQRQRETIPLSPAIPLRNSDELRLPAGSGARFVLSMGVGELRGPQSLLARSLAAKVLSPVPGVASRYGTI